MKINKWIAIALIAILVIGAMGFVSYRVYASTNLFQSQGCSDVEEEEANETAETEDMDIAECENDANEVEESDGADADQSDEAAPATTGISAAEAQAIAEAANPGATTLFVEFDREWGKDIWEVELDNGLDVQVDATTGEILGSEPRE